MAWLLGWCAMGGEHHAWLCLDHYFAGVVRCIAWAASPRSEDSDGTSTSKPRRHTACDTYVIDLTLADHGGGGGSEGSPQLRVVDVRLLRHSVLPPHLVMVNPGQDAVLLGLDPDSCCFPLTAAAAAADPGVTHIDCRQQTGERGISGLSRGGAGQDGTRR